MFTKTHTYVRMFEVFFHVAFAIFFVTGSFFEMNISGIHGEANLADFSGWATLVGISASIALPG